MNDSKTYTNQIDLNELINSICATQDEFQEKVKDLNNKGIQRIEASALINKFGIIHEPVCTVISNAEIIRGGSASSIKDLEWDHLPSVIFINCKISYLNIYNCILKKSEENYTNFYFISTEVDQLHINNCKIGDLYFRDVLSNHSFNINNESTTGSIKLYDKSQIKQISVTNNSVTRGIQIRDKSRIQHFTIDNSKTDFFAISGESKTGNFHIRNQSTTGFFNINGNSQTGNFEIKGSSRIGSFNLRNNSRIGNFVLKENSRTGWLKIYEGSKANSIRIKNKSQTGSIWIKNATLSDLEAEFLVSSITIIKSVVHSLRLNSCYLFYFIFRDQSKTEAFIRDTEINLVDLNQSVIGADSSLSFSSSKIYSCLMDQSTVIGNLYFRNVSALDKIFSLPKFASKESKNEYKTHRNVLKLHHNINNSLFRITHSSLGQTEFIDSDLQSFDVFEFAHSRITNIFISGLKAPDNNLYIKGPKEKSVEWYEQIVSFNNQFSRIFEGQGFIYNAVNYRAKSALIQQKILFKKWTSIFSIFTKSNKKIQGEAYYNLDNRYFIFLEYIPFWFNRWSNNHGKSWGRALIFFAVTSVSMYVWYLLSIGHVFNFNHNIDSLYIGYYFEFINPFRSFSFLDRNEFSINHHTRIVDFLSRVVIGYGIYQFLTAFRKYKKK